MARKTGRLTDLWVRQAKTPGKYPDGGGLYLQVSRAGTKAWCFRFALHGRERWGPGLGPYPDVGVGEARAQARECRRLRREGIDPIEHRRTERQAAKLDAAKGTTFRACAERYIAAHEAGWRNAKHRQQWRSTLETYVYPVFGDLPAAAIDTGLVLKALEPIWTTKPETASRLRGRIESVLDWATARAYRVGDNPARWRGHLDKLLPARRRLARVKHHAAMPWRDVPAFMAELREQDGIGGRALEFAVLTAGRTGEVIGARWSEIDLRERIWTVPAERIKAGRLHRVPLSDRAVELLESLPRDGGEFVFFGTRTRKSPSRRTSAALSNMTLAMTLRRMGRDGITVHGFRSAFRDWAAETTNYPREVAEGALAHIVADKVEAAYRRSDLFDRRRRLMEEWARFCTSKPHTGAVVALRSAR